jgi:hypothetical protein
MLRGGLLAAVTRRLGPKPVIDERQVEVLITRYELELYRAKFGARDGAAKHVSTIDTGGWSDSSPTTPELRVEGGLSQATRRRIAWCADVATIIDRVRNPGLKRPGEM